jgi:hypothetical protein
MKNQPENAEKMLENETPAALTSERHATTSVFKSSGSLGDEVIHSLLTPGLNSTMRVAMNTTFILLIMTLIALAILTSGDLHVVSLLGIHVRPIYTV